MNTKNTPLGEIAALVSVVALVFTITYSTSDYDLWDALVGAVSASFGGLQLSSILREKRAWPPSYLLFGGFLVSALIVGGLASIVLGVFGLDGALWEAVGPLVILMVGLGSGVWCLLRGQSPQDGSAT